MTGGDKSLQAPLFRSMLGACVVEGSYYVVMDDISGTIHSVGTWFGPGQKMFNTQKQREQGWINYFGSLPENVQQWWMNSFLAVHEKELDRLLGDNYLNGWFANIIATDTPFQRRGYATLMIKAVFKRAVADHKAVSLATQTKGNSLWYQKMGFKELGMIDIRSDTGDWTDYFLLWEDSEMNPQ